MLEAANSICRSTTDEKAAVDRAERDLDLAVELVNTYWVLASPPDSLTATEDYRRCLRSAGEEALAAELTDADLRGLRSLRRQLKPVFGAETLEDAVSMLDRLLGSAAVPARLTADDGTARWAWGAGRHGIGALRARLLAALTTHVIRHGISRIGTCQASPCDCVYVDRSRQRTRRYCCDQCNDRAAAAAYRRRKASTSAPRWEDEHGNHETSR
jgi:predicted RNA-binding Zn ribbon-like protein